MKTKIDTKEAYTLGREAFVNSVPIDKWPQAEEFGEKDRSKWAWRTDEQMQLIRAWTDGWYSAWDDCITKARKG